jgi:CIC family chloride channel protein
MRPLKDSKRSDAIPVSVSLDTTSQVDALESKKEIVDKRAFYLSIQAIVNAIMIGAVAKFLVLLINLFTNISFYGKFSFANSNPANNHLGLFVIIVPIIGGLIVGIMARFGSAAIRGHGIPEAMEQVLTNESKIKPVVTFLKPISSAISIGTGGPFGAEGPIIATGGALGSVAGQIMHSTASERKVMLTAGATAGMAAIFGTPSIYYTCSNGMCYRCGYAFRFIWYRSCLCYARYTRTYHTCIGYIYFIRKYIRCNCGICF